VTSRHPTANRPLIDWNLVMMMEPTTIMGAVRRSPHQYVPTSPFLLIETHDPVDVTMHFPLSSFPLIDWNLVMMMEPTTIMGAVRLDHAIFSSWSRVSRVERRQLVYAEKSQPFV
jgi:hypothetical protein